MRAISLRTKFLAGFVGLIVLLGSAVIIFVQTTLSQKLVTELQKRGVFVAKDIAEESINPILVEDIFTLQTLVIDHKEFGEGIEYVFVLDQKGKVLAHTFGEAFPIDLREANIVRADQTYNIQPLTTERGAIFDIAVPILKGEVGVVHLGISEEPIRKSVGNTIGLIVWIIIAVLVLGGGIAVIFATVITKPVFDLTKVAEAVGSGDLGRRVRVKTRDEIGRLGVTFNKMIEDLKTSRDELVLAKDYTDNIIKSMIDTLIVIDPNAKIKTINKATSDLLDYTESELIGKSIAIIFEEEDEITPFMGTRMKKVIEEGFIRNYEAIYKTKSGEKIPISFSGSVMRDKKGTLVGIIGIARDMREVKRLMQKEKEFAAAEATAEVEYKKAAELDKAYKELKETQAQLIQAEKMEAVGRMASGVAHEVKNPLGIILQGINYFEERVPLIQKDKRGILKMMKDSVKRADSIVCAILDFSRVEKLCIKPEDINSIVESSVILIQYKVKFKNIEVIKDFGKDLPRVLADKGKIEQVFVNIFLNAIHAIPKGGKLFIRTYRKQFNEIRFGAGRTDRGYFEPEEFAIIVEIEDTGVGIPENILGKIFDPFFTTKKPGEGTGLGLSVVNKIIDMHKGVIFIKSKKAKGTKVAIVLKMPRGG